MKITDHAASGFPRREPFVTEREEYEEYTDVCRKGNDRAGIYVHIPFCVQKCIYCDFNSIPGCDFELQSGYFDALKKEISDFKNRWSSSLKAADKLSARNGAPIRSEPNIEEKTAFAGVTDPGVWTFADTLFLGGGTPSSVPPYFIEELMAVIREREQVYREFGRGGSDVKKIRSICLLADDAEVTMEVNPGTVDFESLVRYRKAGINRLSIGVQSFNDEELEFLGRIHSAEDAERCFYDARRAGFENINIDLIFGFPGNTLEMWKKTLKRVIDLQPDHISFYSLQIEEETPLYEMFRKDMVEQISDEINRQMYHDAVQMLKERGYVHYEISNASLPGKQCRHNLKYWSMCDYVGFGLSAHSYLCDNIRVLFDQYPIQPVVPSADVTDSIGGIIPSERDEWKRQGGARYYNEDDILEYIARIRNNTGGYIPLNAAHNSLADEISETIFTGLRKTEGVDLEWFDRRFSESGVAFMELYGEKIKPFLRDELLILQDHHLRFSLRGFDISNYILSELIIG